MLKDCDGQYRRESKRAVTMLITHDVSLHSGRLNQGMEDSRVSVHRHCIAAFVLQPLPLR